MSDKSATIAKILLLYLISSLLFLGYFFANDYQMKKDALITSEVKNLKELKMGVYMKARMNGLDAAGELLHQKGASGCILTASGAQIYAHEPCASEREGVFISGGRVGIFEPIQNMEDEQTDELARANIVLLGRDIASELLWLQLKAGLNLTALLAAILLIAYFLARLALAPLYAQISALNRFIKDSTHEINTPLSVILMSIETMDKTTMSERNLKRTNNIELAAKSLSALYDDLSHLAFKKRAPSRENIDLAALASERFAYFAPFFAKRNLHPTLNLAPASITANKSEMTKILDNLISNAVKYTDHGGSVELALRAGKLTLTNSGEGLDERLRERIFERYARFNDAQGGFGIGLSIVKICCENNNISVSCDSERGKWTKFSLTWEQI